MNTITSLEQLAREYEQHLPDLRLPAGHPGSRPVARWVDHTLLKPEATPQQVEALCAEAREYQFATVCVNPVYVPLSARLLHGSPVLVCTVVGFPLGAALTETKVAETRQVIAAGAREVDMVIPIGQLKGGQSDAVYQDIWQVTQAAHEHGVLVKVILEMALLTRYEKILSCLLVQQAGAEFVKTSTGFSTGGATVEDVELMRRVVGSEMGVKAAGGVRSLEDARAMLAAGATRLGSSAGVKLAQQEQAAA